MFYFIGKVVIFLVFKQGFNKKDSPIFRVAIYFFHLFLSERTCRAVRDDNLGSNLRGNW